MALAFSNNGATPNKPSSGLDTFLNKSKFGLTPQIQKSSLTPTLNPQVQPVSNVSQGTNPGLIKSRVDASGATTNYETKSNPSVLAQQQALNKLGAGLVEDGITGPKTREAIAKYSGASSTPTPEPAPIPPKPLAGSTVGEQIQNVAGAGQQTENERATQEALQRSGQATPLEQEYINRVQKAQAMQNLGSLGGFAEAGMRAQQSPEQLFDALINAPDLAGRAGASQGLYNALSNIYGSQATQGLLAANTIAGRGAQTAQGAFSGAQAQAQRGLGAQQSVLGAVAPITGVPFGTQTVQPGLLSDTSGTSGGEGILKGSAAQLIPQYYNDFTQAQTTLDNITKNEQLFSNLLSTARVNPTDLTPINELLQRVGQLTSSQDYANFQNLISSLRANYTQLLASRGLTPTEAGSKANSLLPDNASVATINSVLNTLKQEGQNYLSSKADQLKRAQETLQTGTAPDTSKPTTKSSTSSFGWDALN